MSSLDHDTASPMIEIALGTPAALEDEFLRAVGAARTEDPLAPVDVLVGGILQRPYLERLIADRGPGVVNVRVSTAGELGLRLGAPALAASRMRALPVIAERALVGEVAARCGGYFAPVAGSPGFAEAVRRTVRELRQEGVTPRELARHAPAALESAEKAADFADLYARYASSRAGLYDGLDALARADAGLFDGSRLILFGIWRLPAHARALVERLAERVPLLVLLPSLDAHADEAHRDLRDWLTARSARVRELAGDPAAGALGHLQSRLFAHGAPRETDESVQLVSAPDPVAETREAARACLAWARQGIPFRDMAVTYRQADLYRPLVEAVFAEAGIPVYLDDGPPLAERPVGRRILALIDLIDSPLRRRDVMAFLSDGWMPQATRERFGGAPRARWDAISRSAGVVEGADQWRDRLAVYAERLRGDDDELEEVPEWRARRLADTESLAAFIAELAQRLSGHPRRSTWGQALDVLQPLLADYIEGAEDVVAFINQLRDIDGLVPEVEFGHFLRVVRAEVRGMRAGDLDEGSQGAFGRRGVNVLDANQLRHLRFRAVAVLGLAERAFPPPPRQDPLLLDGERRALNAAGGWDLPLRAQGADPEPLQFGLAVHAARERLLVSTRRADEAGGRAQLPSAFFRLAAAAMEGRRVGVDEVPWLRCVRRLRAGRVGAGDLASGLTLAERDRTLLELAPATGRSLLERIEPRTARADALRRARWAKRTFTPYDAVFADPAARAALDEWLSTGFLSATGLERYAGCPFRFFLDKVLRVRPLEEPERLLRMSALDKGSMVHTILQRFIAEETIPLAPATRAHHQATLRAIAEQECDAAEMRGLTGTPLLWSADRRELIEDLEHWLDLELADIDPLFSERHVEVGFGITPAGPTASPLATEEPLIVEAAGRRVRLRGSVDRIDRAPGGFKVIDYKTGAGRYLPKDNRLAKGQALQLPLYLRAAAMMLGIDPSLGSASYVLVSRRGGFKRVRFDGRALAARAEDVETALGLIVGGMGTGDFHPEPGRACRSCDYANLCDVGRERQRERKADDPRAVAFTTLGDIE
jgi:ATP-dependent helicase/nuclease subunit B